MSALASSPLNPPAPRRSQFAHAPPKPPVRAA